MAKKTKNEFMQGYACAVAVIEKSHGLGTPSKDALKDGGLTSIAKMRELGIDEYDIEILRPLVKEIQRDEKYRKRLAKRKTRIKDRP